MCKIDADEPRVERHKVTLYDTKVLYDSRRVQIIIHGISETVRIGCTEVSFAALERIYNLYRRHREAIRFEAQ